MKPRHHAMIAGAIVAFIASGFLVAYMATRAQLATIRPAPATASTLPEIALPAHRDYSPAYAPMTDSSPTKDIHVGG